MPTCCILVAQRRETAGKRGALAAVGVEAVPNMIKGVDGAYTQFDFASLSQCLLVLLFLSGAIVT